MANQDFQNGLIVGLASKGITTQETLSFEKSSVEVRQPVYAEPSHISLQTTSPEFKTEISIEESE